MSEEKIETQNFPFFISPAGKHYYCYKDLDGKNQHSNTFDSYDEALEDYSKVYMTKVDQPKQSPVKTLDELVEKHLHFEGKTNDKWYLRASIKNYLEYGNVSGSFWEAIKSIVEESQPVPVTEGREWVNALNESPKMDDEFEMIEILADTEDYNNFEVVLFDGTDYYDKHRNNEDGNPLEITDKIQRWKYITNPLTLNHN